jgi:hypothetical protein
MNENLVFTIKHAWQQACMMYLDGKITTEATLQAALYCYLLGQLDKTFTLLCEPEVRIANAQYKPDLLVLQGSSVAAAFELKFVPHSYAEDQRDFKKLSIYAQHTAPLKFLLDAKTGHYSIEEHTFAKDCVFVFAALAKHNAAAVLTEYAQQNASNYPSLDGRFLHLYHPVGG